MLKPSQTKDSISKGKIFFVIFFLLILIIVPIFLQFRKQVETPAIEKNATVKPVIKKTIFSTSISTIFPETTTPIEKSESTIVTDENIQSATTIAPTITSTTTTLFNATGSFTSAIFGSYNVIVFTGNGSLQLNKQASVSMIVVAGGGGGSGGSTTSDLNPFTDVPNSNILGGNGGMGGSNLLCSLAIQSLFPFMINVNTGLGGSGGTVESSGNNGGDTYLSIGTTKIVECKGGVGGVYAGTNTTLSPSYSVDTKYTTNLQAGNTSSNQGGQGGTFGYFYSAGTSKTAGVGSNSSTYNQVFSGIPLDVLKSSYVKTCYGGGGGGGGIDLGGKAGSNGKGGGANTISTGETATFYGEGGGGGGVGNKGGSGSNGIVVFYITESTITVTTLLPTTTLTPTPSTTTISKQTTTTLKPTTMIPHNKLVLSGKGQNGDESITISTNNGTLKTIILSKVEPTSPYTYILSYKPTYVNITFNNDSSVRDVFLTKLEYNGINLLATYINSDPTKQTYVRQGTLAWGMTYQFTI